MWGFDLTTDPFSINDTKNKNERQNIFLSAKEGREGLHYFKDNAIIKNTPMNAALVWVQFFACLGVIIIAGTRLALYGDMLGEKTRLGRVWIGVVVLAAITSLPELSTGISSVTIFNQPDLTMGDLFGSNLINLVIIAVIDLVYTRGHVLLYLGTGIVLSTVLSITMIAAAAASIYLAQNHLNITLFGRIGVYSLALFCLYLLSQYVIYRFKSARGEETQDNQSNPASQHIKSPKHLLLYFLIAAGTTVGAGIWLSHIGNQIVETTGLSATLIGSLFFAICTSAPEMVVSISAVRLGALDMAVGNMVGSNLFNMGVIIFVNDLFYEAGPILTHVDMVHIVTALFAILMSTVILIGIIFRPRLWLRFWIGADTALLVILYFGAILALYFLGR